jgi:AcrR family transcriptional regulator
MKKRTTISKVRTPKQERGIKTREKILKAARSVFAKKGYYGTDSNEIAAAAGVSTGSFYAYFNDKKDLFIETLRIYNSEVLQIILQDFLILKNTKDNKGLITFLIKKILEAHNLSPKFHREAIAMMYTNNDVFSIQLEEDRKVIGVIESFMAQNRDVIKVKNLNAAATILFRASESIVHSIKISHCLPDENELLNELSDMIYNYLF